MQSQEAILKWWKNRKNYMMNIEITYIPIETKKRDACVCKRHTEISANQINSITSLLFLHNT